jgi:hypothetical protein
MGNYKGEDRLEKHYTPDKLIDELFDMKDRLCDVEVTEYLENSAGGGSICDRFDKPYIAYDIEPEPDRTDIIKADYLKQKIEYKKGRVAIINPPFNKGLKFVYKSLEESDWCFAILSKNSLLNIDYNKYYAAEIQLYKNYDFGTCKVGIILVALRKWREGDSYD